MEKKKKDCSLRKFFNMELKGGKLVLKDSRGGSCKGACWLCNRCRYLDM